METVKINSGDYGSPCVTGRRTNEIGCVEMIWPVIVVRNDHVCGSVFSVMRDGDCDGCVTVK